MLKRFLRWLASLMPRRFGQYGTVPVVTQTASVALLAILFLLLLEDA
jgi:hypothetical protein